MMDGNTSAEINDEKEIEALEKYLRGVTDEQQFTSSFRVWMCPCCVFGQYDESSFLDRPPSWTISAWVWEAAADSKIRSFKQLFPGKTALRPSFRNSSVELVVHWNGEAPARPFDLFRGTWLKRRTE
jgi:hypothetical protein